MSRRALALLAAFGLIAALAPGAGASSARAGRYIVVLEDSVNDPGAVAREHARSQNARLDHVYRHAMKGYAARMSDVAADRIARDPRVDYVEVDGEVHKTSITESTSLWGLDRIDQHALPLSSTYSYTSTGDGVTAYIIDSGVRRTHLEFEGRAVIGPDYVQDDNDSDDCDGHGTHVAGTVGSRTYGVAKKVTLVGVRVLDCNGSGYWSDVIAGVNWVTAEHVKGQPAVANMSLGGGYSTAVNDAVTNSVADGVTYAVSAGNGNRGGKEQDACGNSPASTPSALTVGATDKTDTKASWSNYGACVDLFGPGVGITSTTMDGETATWSGTSMSSPHVAGVAALYLQGNPAASAETVSAAITGSATTGVVKNAGSGSPDLLLYSLLTESPPPSMDPVAPVAADDSAAAQTGDTVTVDVLANDSDENGDALTVTELTPATGGSAVLSSDHKAVVYTAPDTAGTYSFTYKASDGERTSASATVTITVTDPPPPPEGAATATVNYGTSGGKASDKHLWIRVVLADADGGGVGGTVVEVSISNGTSTWLGSGTTLSDGSVTWEIKNAPTGSYQTTVERVGGAVWPADQTTDLGYSKT